MRILGKSSTCNDADTCPQIVEAPELSDDLYVQGYDNIDPKVVQKMAPPTGERLVRVPRQQRDLFIQAGKRLERQQLFTSAHTVFRLETLPAYHVPDDNPRWRAFRDGQPLPERSAHTSPWLRQIADATTAGANWTRVHLLHRTLTDLMRFELLTDLENVAAGEDVRVVDLEAAPPELAGFDQDFWLFDPQDSGRATAVRMLYDAQGRFVDSERSTDPDVLFRCRQQRILTLRYSVPVADYLAEAGLAPSPVG